MVPWSYCHLLQPFSLNVLYGAKTITRSKLIFSLSYDRHVLYLSHRSYTKKTNQTEMDISTEEDLAKIETLNCEQKKVHKKKKKAHKSTKSINLETQGMTNIELNFPFEGTIEKSKFSGELDASKLQNLSDSTTAPFSVHIRDTSGVLGGRSYTVQKDGEIFNFPSVTTVLSHTVPKQRGFMLSNWRKGLVKEFGEDGYLQVRDEIKALGNRFHEELASYLNRPHVLSIKPQTHIPPQSTPHSLPPTSVPFTSLPPPLSRPPNHNNFNGCDIGEGREGVLQERGDVGNNDELESNNSSGSAGYMESVQPVLADISEVYSLESVVAHMELGYSGTYDCIAVYRGSVCLIDWKTSSKPRPLISDLYDYPLQAVAYAGAVNQDPHYPFKVKNVVIVTAYPSGESCHAHFIPLSLCIDYWKQWLDRLLHFQTLFSTDLGDIIL